MLKPKSIVVGDDETQPHFPTVNRGDHLNTPQPGGILFFAFGDGQSNDVITQNVAQLTNAFFCDFLTTWWAMFVFAQVTRFGGNELAEPGKHGSLDLAG